MTSPLPGLALRSLRRRALRSALTALTAAVAVATVFATRGLLRGSEIALEQDLHRLGTRTVQVLDGIGFLGPAPLSEPLRRADTEAARAVLRREGVGAEVLDARVRLGVVRREGERSFPVPLLETTPAYALTFHAVMASGRFLEEGDLAPGAAPVCVLDAETAREIGVAAAGGEILLRDAGKERRLRVAGILADPFRMRISTHAPDLTSSARRAAITWDASSPHCLWSDCAKPVIGSTGSGWSPKINATSGRPPAAEIRAAVPPQESAMSS